MVTNWMWLLLGVRGHSHVYTIRFALRVRWFRIDYELNMKRQSTSFHPDITKRHINHVILTYSAHFSST